MELDSLQKKRLIGASGGTNESLLKIDNIS